VHAATVELDNLKIAQMAAIQKGIDERPHLFKHLWAKA
jgi:hypothetical protein